MTEKSDAWLNMKLKASEKELVKRASDLEDRTMSNFVKRAALKAARQTIEREGS